jgi:hypothetical protein
LYLEQNNANSAFAGVWMSETLSRKYPNARKSLGWQYLFPASRLSIDPESGKVRRHHHDESNVNKNIKIAASKAGIIKGVSCHTLLCNAAVMRFPNRSLSQNPGDHQKNQHAEQNRLELHTGINHKAQEGWRDTSGKHQKR